MENPATIRRRPLQTIPSVRTPFADARWKTAKLYGGIAKLELLKDRKRPIAFIIFSHQVKSSNVRLFEDAVTSYVISLTEEG